MCFEDCFEDDVVCFGDYEVFFWDFLVYVECGLFYFEGYLFYNKDGYGKFEDVFVYKNYRLMLLIELFVFLVYII